MSTLIQISDPHFGTEQPQVVAALIAFVRRVQPLAAVLSGDITQRARRAQFAAAKRFVDQLGVPHCLVIPCNHDVPLFNIVARVFFPYAGFERVARQLRGANGSQLRIVVTHQPVHVLRASEVHNRVHGYHEAVQAWADAGADIIMGGHIHLPYVASLDEHFPELSRRCWAVQAGTAVSHRVRANHPNSVNLIHYSAGSGQCSVERWDYDATGANFRCVATQELLLERQRD